MKTGRNEPCPCGSGLKYKKCCADKESAKENQPPQMAAVMADVGKVLEEQEFESIEEANAFLSRYMQQRNQVASLDFQGLSSEQIHHILYTPFDSPRLVTFPDELDAVPDVPMMKLFHLLVEAIGDKGLKPTATGNLPRNFCREAALTFWGEEKYQKHTRYHNISSEPDFQELHIARLVAEIAGMIRKYKGKFILGRDCRKLIEKSGLAAIYPRLLRAYVETFNWAYRDGYPELPFIQRAFLFSLYLLYRHGQNRKPNSFYEDAFLRAFPDVLKDVPEDSYFGPEHNLRSCYTLRTFEHFATFLGLAVVESTDKTRYDREFQIMKTPLLDAAVVFNI